MLLTTFCLVGHSLIRENVVKGPSKMKFRLKIGRSLYEFTCRMVPAAVLGFGKPFFLNFLDALLWEALHVPGLFLSFLDAFFWQALHVPRSFLSFLVLGWFFFCILPVCTGCTPCFWNFLIYMFLFIK